MTGPEQPPFPLVPGFEPLRLLGRGGMGDVFLARDSTSGETIALKLLTPANTEHGDEQQRRFERETTLVQGLAHRNLVPILNHGVAAGHRYFVMEYVEGHSLRELLTPGQPLPTTMAQRLLQQIAEGLVYLAQRGVVHRDLKPENVLVQPDGTARITDFGIAVTASDAGALTRTDQLLGTPDYMAPEQRARLPLDARADQFSLAVVAYELLTGRRPVGSFKPASRHNPQLPRAVDRVLARGLADEPDDRFPTTQAFAEALSRALESSPVSRLPVAVALGASMLAVVGVGIWLASRPRATEPTAAEQPPLPVIVVPTNPEPSDEQNERRDRERREHIREAELHSLRRERAEAVRCYTAALALGPDDPILLTRRAHELKLLRRSKEAWSDLDEAIRLNPRFAEARVGRGSLFLQEGEYRKAILEFDLAIEVEPRNATAVANRGYCRRRTGDLDGGILDLDRAIEIDPDCGVAYHYRGLVRNTKKDYAGAKADFQNSVRCTPDNPFAHSALASLLAECPEAEYRDPARAVQHAQKACELSNFAEWRELRTLAAAQAADGNLPEAIRTAEKAIRLAPAGRDRQTIQSRLDEYRKRLTTPEPTP